MHESMNKTNMLKINEVTQNMQRRKKKCKRMIFFLYEIGGAECNMGVSNNKTVEKIKTATERAVGPTDFGFGLMVVYKQILPRFPHFSLFISLSKNLLSPLSCLLSSSPMGDRVAGGGWARRPAVLDGGAAAVVVKRTPFF